MKYIFVFCTCFFIQFGFSQNDAVIELGEKLINENKLDEAITYYNKQLLTVKNDEQKVHFLLGLADSYKYKLDYKTSNDCYLKTFELIKSINNSQLEFFYYVKMAEFYRKRALFKESADYLNKAEKISKHKLVNDSYLTKFYSRKAALFTEYYMISDSTLFYAKKALKLAEENNDQDAFFYATLEISSVYENRKDFKKTIVYLEDLIEFSKKNNLIQNQVDASINYTRVLIKDKQYTKALKESLKALEFSEKNNLFFGRMLFIDNVRNTYAKLGNMPKAYEYAKKRIRISEEFYKKEHDKYLFELEEKYKLSEKENQIKLKNAEIVNSNKKLLLVLFIFSISLLTTFALIYYYRKTKSKNLLLEKLSNENKFLLSEANHRINNNLQLIIILISDQLKKLPKSQQTELNNVLKKIDSIATLHRHLYKYPDKNEIDCQKYLKEIAINFNDLFKENNIDTDINIESFMISTDVAMYLGLLFTELCINSLKHAFENQEFKQIKLDLKLVNNEINFQYSDNGNENINENIQPKLIDKLCRQLKVVYKINTLNGFSFSFKNKIN